MKKQAIFLIAMAAIVIVIAAIFLFFNKPSPNEDTNAIPNPSSSITSYSNNSASNSLNNTLNLTSESNMKIKSVFENNTKIPEKYTCDGQDINPPLEISDIPKNAKTLAIIVDDPDAPAGTWLHWTIWNIEVTGSSISISEGEAPGTEGKNDFGNTEYGSPCPPSGTHRYFFKVYALDSSLVLEKGSSKKQLERAMQGHILDKAEIIGLYSKK